MPNLVAAGPLLLSAGVLATLMAFESVNPRVVRASAAGVCMLVGIRYLWWRFDCSMPVDQNPMQQTWSWVFLFFESLAGLTTLLGFLFMSRNSRREPPAQIPSPLSDAPVDVFIATYNEPYQVLERTIVGATAIDHADLRIWVLDDGARPWVRELAEELGVHYVHRVKGKHAKAGNVNNGLAWALKTGRAPAFILLLDADFVPFRTILKRTLGLFGEADVGIVQTPQHFFNPDPIQSNLLVANLWPDEQRFFFNSLLPCKDAWGAAFCCGTSALIRVEALVAAGGMATETVTEDMLTSFKLLEHGYRTVFLNERLSMGLAPEGLSAYISQRARWCLGAMQQIYTRWSFLGHGKINLINRLSSLEGVIYWISNSAFKLMIIGGPLIYWWTGTSVISTTIADLVRYLAPAVVCSFIFMGRYAEKRVVPVITDVTHLMTSFSIVATVAVSLVRPWGHPFKVTAKGVATDRVVIHWRLLLAFASLALATMAGIVINISRFSPLYGTEGYELNVFWSIFNIAVLVVACAVCIELPRWRTEERFQSNEPAVIRLTNGMQVPCTVRDLSTGGARLALGFGTLRAGDEGVLIFRDGVEASFKMARSFPGGIGIRFDDQAANRRKLIVRLFTGGYTNDVPQIEVGKVFVALGRRLAA